MFDIFRVITDRIPVIGFNARVRRAVARRLVQVKESRQPRG